MNEPTITAEDLTLYALDLLEAPGAAQVELLLQTSDEACEELRRIRGDLALFAMAIEQQAPNPLTRQRLLKQVARERRALPVPLASPEAARGPVAPVYVADASSPVIAERPASVPYETASSTDPRSRKAAEVAVSEEAAFPAMPWPVRRAERSTNPPEHEELRNRLTPRDNAPAALTGALVDPFEAENQPRDRYEPSANFAFKSFEVSEESPRSGVSAWFAWTGWAAAAALAAAGAFALRDNFALRREVAVGAAEVARANASAARAQLVFQTLQSGATQRFVLARADAAPAPTGRVAYLPEHGTLLFQGSNMEPLAPYKTYELWLIPAGEGQHPVPAGTFKPDVRGYASLVLPQVPKGLVASNFGITVEEEGGASAPTLPILLIGQQS